MYHLKSDIVQETEERIFVKCTQYSLPGINCLKEQAAISMQRLQWHFHVS